MNDARPPKGNRMGKLLLITLLVAAASVNVASQSAGTYAERKQQALELYKQSRITEALPLLEDLAKTNGQDVEVWSALGFCLYAVSTTTADDAQRAELATRSRTTLEKAREMGDKSTLTEVVLATLAQGPPAYTRFSQNQEADRDMKEAELFFVKGDLPGAFELYQRALTADPHLYDAALYAGDTLYKTEGKLDQAPAWYAKAIAIDPDRETAYRYWGDVLMTQQKPGEARAKYVEAYICDPHDRLPVSALVQFAESQKLKLGHPLVDVPTNFSRQENGDSTITVDASALGGKGKGGGYAWVMYGLTRANWASKKFAETHPSEKKYRHSLQEEAEALRAVIRALDDKSKKSKDLDPSLANLIKLDQAGVLEAFILMARADEGILQDYPSYLKEHRAELRRYVNEWVMQGGQS